MYSLLPPSSPSVSTSLTASVSSSLSTLFRPLPFGPIPNIHTLWPLCIITLASMYVILTVPIATPAAILIQFQLMRIITHTRGYEQTDGDEPDDDSDSDDDSAPAEAKPPPSPLCIEIIRSDSGDTSPQRRSRELDKTITQRTSSQSQSPTQDEESIPLPPVSPAIPPPLIGAGSMMIMPTANDTAAANIVHFSDIAIEIDDDDDVVGHSTSPPMTTSRLWLLWSAAGEWRLTGKQWFSAFESNTAVSA